jgi:hypothetical protein
MATGRPLPSVTGMRATGLSILALLGVLDVVELVLTGTDQGPPVIVSIIVALLGVITLVAVVPAWRGSRAGTFIVFGSRILSAALLVPAFFISGTPGWVQVMAVAVIVLTIMGIWLVAATARTSIAPVRSA